MQEGVINRSYMMFSAGTRVYIISDNNKPWRKKGDVISHGYITVKLRTNPSNRMIQTQKHIPDVFDIEREYVTPLRNRFDLITVKEK